MKFKFLIPIFALLLNLNAQSQVTTKDIDKIQETSPSIYQLYQKCTGDKTNLTEDEKNFCIFFETLLKNQINPPKSFCDGKIYTNIAECPLFTDKTKCSDCCKALATGAELTFCNVACSLGTGEHK